MMMKNLNEEIIKFNDKTFSEDIEIYQEQNGGVAGTRSKAPRFHKLGIRKETIKYPDGKKREKTRHRWEHWRENVPMNMLHLNDEQRLRMGRKINNFFINQFIPAIDDCDGGDGSEEVAARDEMSATSPGIMDKEEEAMWSKLCAKDKQQEDAKRREELREKMKTFLETQKC